MIQFCTGMDQMCQALCITAAIQQRSPFMLLQLLDQIHPTHEAGEEMQMRKYGILIAT